MQRDRHWHTQLHTLTSYTHQTIQEIHRFLSWILTHRWERLLGNESPLVQKYHALLLQLFHLLTISFYGHLTWGTQMNFIYINGLRPNVLTPLVVPMGGSCTALFNNCYNVRLSDANVLIFVTHDSNMMRNIPWRFGKNPTWWRHVTSCDVISPFNITPSVYRIA